MKKDKVVKSNNGHARGRFKVGDRVQVRDMPNIFYTRTQNYVRGVTGTIAACTYQDLIPEDEAFNYDGRPEQYYIVRFRQKDLWEEYPFDRDTLQTEFPEHWLVPVRN
jgi:thiocyanate hydrolase subunit beta